MENYRLLKKSETDMQPNFAHIQTIISAESNLLHPDLASLERSFDQGLAVALNLGDETVGLVRFTPLLDEELKQAIGIPDFPSIWELGTAIVAAEHRGKGLYNKLQNGLLESFKDEMSQGRLLVLGTTKTIAVLKALRKTEELGLDFHIGEHTEFPMIAPFTCVCTPDFGCGFQLTKDCPQRVAGSQLISLDEIAESSYDKTKIPCTMFVSSKNLASQIDDDLMLKFSEGLDSPQAALVNRLKGVGYYG
ncbi:MAG TPA: hypothetical protein VG965_05150 [Patescibacteria group bacterium]|nr:hypothetical protein [Patescibacteria group bacterium]